MNQTVQSNASEPLVSVVVPTYNSAEFLGQAFDSISAQSYPNLEIVISDDGSTDATLAIAEEFATRDARVRVSRNDRNLGPAGNFRRCIALASGEFVKFLIPDDLLMPDCIQRLVESMLQDERILLATSRRSVIDADGSPLPDVAATRPPFESDRVVDGRQMAHLMLTKNRNLIGEPSTALLRASAVTPKEAFFYGGHEYRVLADMSLWLTLCERGSVYYATEPLSCFRRHPGQDQHSIKLVLRGNFEWARLSLDAHRRGLLRTRSTLFRSFFVARLVGVFDFLRRRLGR